MTTHHYYFLRVGEYTKKGFRNDSKQTKQFRWDDVTVFNKDKEGKLRLLPHKAPSTDILTADGAMLKLYNQKHGWKGVCIHHEANGEPWNCAVRALGRHFTHIRDYVKGSSGWRTHLSVYYMNGIWYNVSYNNMWDNLKWAA